MGSARDAAGRFEAWRSARSLIVRAFRDETKGLGLRWLGGAPAATTRAMAAAMSSTAKQQNSVGGSTPPQHPVMEGQPLDPAARVAAGGGVAPAEHGGEERGRPATSGTHSET